MEIYYTVLIYRFVYCLRLGVEGRGGWGVTVAYCVCLCVHGLRGQNERDPMSKLNKIDIICSILPCQNTNKTQEPARWERALLFGCCSVRCALLWFLLFGITMCFLETNNTIQLLCFIMCVYIDCVSDLSVVVCIYFVFIVGCLLFFVCFLLSIVCLNICWFPCVVWWCTYNI